MNLAYIFIKDSLFHSHVRSLFGSRVSVHLNQICLDINDFFSRLLCFIYCCYHHFKAFGATEAMTDRICIASNGEKKPHLSAEDLATCCSSCGSGCEGGYPGAAWQYWEDTGTQRVILTTRRINIQGQQ